MSYTKTIKLTPTGMVIAWAYDSDHSCVCMEVFSSFFGSTSPRAIENNLKRAHKWADAIIALCKKHECNRVEVTPWHTAT